MYYHMKLWTIVGCTLLISAAACKKAANAAKSGGGGGTTTTTGVDSTYNPTDPPAAATIGFFGNAWQARTLSLPADASVTPTMLPVTDSLTINLNDVVVKTPPYLFGNNSNLWMGQIVTQANLMQYIKDLSPNIIRAPAGSISDVYFWNGTAANPTPSDAPAQVYTSGTLGSIGQWYGGNTGPGTLSLANYYNLLAQTNSTGIITV